MRKLRGFTAGIVTAIACLLAGFHLYTGSVQALAAQWQRGIHVGVGFLLIFLLFPASRSEKVANSRVWFAADLVLGGLALAFTYYYLSTIEQMIYRQGMPNTADIVFSTIAIAVTLEATRRTIGWVLTAIAGFFLVYALFGAHFPEVMSHPGMTWDWVSTAIFLSTEGIYGIPIGVTSTFVFLFVLFAAGLGASGGDHLISDIGAAVFGRTRGGSGKVTVFTGLMIGMISGSPVADAAAVGSLCIPTMKKRGFSGIFSASLSAVAANGGAFMPPVMGAAAFIMAEFTGVTYWEICKMAFIPAVLYYFSLYMAADFEAGRRGIAKIPPEERPQLLAVLKKSTIIIVPFTVLVYTMGVMAVTPQRSAALAFLSLVAVYVAQETLGGRMSFGGLLRYLVKVLEAGTRGMLVIIATCACAGIIVGIINVTGLGVQLSSIAIELSGGKLLPLLLMTMVASLILGMGLTVTAVYIILAVLAAPALVQAGVSPVGAHLFVFYFGIVSGLTPPVALTAYVTATIAETPVFRTGWQSFVLGLVSFLIPFVWVYDPSLILGGTVLGTIYAVTICGLSVVALAAGIQGFLWGVLPWHERLLAVACGVFIILPEAVTDVVGLSALALWGGYRFLLQRRRDQGATLAARPA